MNVIAPWWQELSSLFSGFAWPWMWLALPLPLLVSILFSSASSQSPALHVPYGEHLDNIAKVNVGKQRIRINWLAAIAWFFLCAAAARPQLLGEPITPPQTGRNLMLVVDLSGSMSETDVWMNGVPVTRLVAAKAVLSDFLDRRVGDRIGLLVFGSRAYAVSPMTLDREAVHEQLRDMHEGIAGQETAIGDALGLGIKRLSEQPVGQRVLILLTDGVSNVGALEPQKAAEIAKNQGVRIHTIGFGGGPKSLFFGVRDNVDEESLRSIASTTGGQFFRARDTGELANIYSELDKIEPIEQQGQAVQPVIERYPQPLTWALVFGVLALAWRGIRK